MDGRSAKSNKFKRQIIFFLALSIIFVSGITYMINQKIEDILLNNFQSKIYSLGETFKSNIASSMTINDKYAINIFAHDICRDKDIYSCLITNEYGEIIAEKNDDHLPKKLSFLELDIIIMEQDFGNIKIGYSSGNIGKKINLIKRYISLSSFVLIIILTFTILLVPNSLIKPILKISGLSGAGLEHRNYYRITVDMAAKIQFNGSLYDGRISDISLGGVCLETRLNLDDKSEFSLIFSWDKENFNIKSIALRKISDEDIKKYGVEFINLNLWTRAKLAPCLEARQH